MKWTYSIKNKMMAATLLFVIVALVLVNNLNERDTTSQINQAIKSIYDDRLIAESYIIKYMQDTHNMMDIIGEEKFSPELKQQLSIPILVRLAELNSAYEQTSLTENEAADFKKLLGAFSNIEFDLRNYEFDLAKEHSAEAVNLLHSLSQIQIAEAERQMSKIDKLTSSTALYFQLEVAVLIIIGAMIQALIFAEKTLVLDRSNQNAYLN